MIFDLFGTERQRLKEELQTNSNLLKEVREKLKETTEELEKTKKVLGDTLNNMTVLGMPELDEMADTLFPALEIHKKEEQEIYVDYAVDMNLAVVLKDIQTQQVDIATVGSLKDAMGRIEKVKNMLSLNRGTLNRKIKYYVVGNEYNPDWMEEIKIKDDPL